jgi:N-acetylmuramoyl-L-alanine amidase
MKISFDAGHGGFGVTPGKRCPDGSMYEWDFNSAVVKYAIAELTTYENVQTLRVDDPTGKTDVPLKTRTDKVNVWGSQCHVSIHANAYGSTFNEAHGIETFVYKTTLIEAVGLANKVQASLVAATGLTNRGVKAGDLHLVRETHMTAILVEGPFMTNSNEARLLKLDAFRRNYALSLVAGLASFYGLKKKVMEVKKEETDMLEKAIVINGFPDMAFAEVLAARLKAPIYTRSALPGGKVAKELYVVGGSVAGLQADKIISLTGSDRFAVAAAVKKFLG